MAEADAAAVPLEAKSPYEMRVKLGEGLEETSVRAALKTGDMGFLHSYTTGSAVDGPGIRVVAWTTACMFRCQFCHNPDTWTLSNGIPVSLEKAIEKLRSYARGIKLMNGGFTLSGGEPLMQDRFAIRLLAAARDMGIHTALETNGFLGERLSDEELVEIDLVLLDMKAFTLEHHKEVTGGINNEAVIAFARRLAALGRPMWLRYVLVPGLTDLTSEMEPLADFAAGLGNVQRVEILPFHQLGEYKWENLALDYKLKGVEMPTRDQVDQAIAIFASRGLMAC